MVKGINKRVVVIRPSGKGIFEEAIFILRGDAAQTRCSADDILKEACSIANNYMIGGGESDAVLPLFRRRYLRLRVQLLLRLFGFLHPYAISRGVCLDKKAEDITICVLCLIKNKTGISRLIR